MGPKQLALVYFSGTVLSARPLVGDGPCYEAGFRGST
jgi:hypothetical protein